MNANEILDELKYVTKVLNMNTDVDTKPLVEAATMLRQQQAEIEALKQIIDANNLNQNIGQFVKPTNEPVGVVCEFEGTLVGTLFEQLPDGTKLYTHPVKEQSTNERIEMLKEMVEKIANPAGWIGYYEGKPATFLFKQEDVPRFLKNTDPVGSVIPLYTHPVKEQDTDCQYCKQGCIRCDARKQLTDEEIGQFKGEWYRGDYASFYDLVRAILRKAQE